MAQQKRFGPLKRATQQNLKKLPEQPGMYSLNSESGKRQYIGIAKQGRPEERIKEHKEEGKIPFTKFGFMPTKTKEEAARIEKRTIKQSKPPYNKQGK